MTGRPPLVLVAPSGAGKTTIARALVDGSDEFEFSVSATTRAPRPGEVDGVDYHFLDVDAFEARVEAGGFAEWARVHDRYYGTPLTELDKARERGHQAVLDIDVQGALQILERVPDALVVFILPPSGAALLRRLAGRGTEDRDEQIRRMRTAREELRAARQFERFVVNDDLESAVEEVRRIARGEASGVLAPETLDHMLRTIWDEVDAALQRASAAPDPS